MQRCSLLLQSCICATLRTVVLERLLRLVIWNILIPSWFHTCTVLLPELVILLHLFKLSVPQSPHLEVELFPFLSSLTQKYRRLMG